MAGEVDFWSLETLKELGKTKAYCSVGVEWAPNGRYVLTSVLHERVKVDNEMKLFTATGQNIAHLNFKDAELYDV